MGDEGDPPHQSKNVQISQSKEKEGWKKEGRGRKEGRGSREESWSPGLYWLRMNSKQKFFEVGNLKKLKYTYQTIDQRHFYMYKCSKK